MRREHILARILRAVSGKTQEEFAAAIRVDPSLIAYFELGKVLPSRHHLKAMAKTVGITLEEAEENLRRYETQRSRRSRRGQSAEDLLDEMAQGLRSRADGAYRLLLTLPLPESLPKPEDRQRAEELFGRLKKRPQEMRMVMVADAEEYQSWSLCEKCCDASVREASRDLEASAAWAQVAQEIAKWVRGPEGWRRRIRGYAAAHAANIVRVAGEPKAAEAPFEEAKRLWLSGSDPAGVLDPGRLLHLEASLRRAQRRFDEALACLAEAEAVGRQPELALIQRGFTLEVMGDYEGAVEALLRAAPRLDRQADPLPWYNQRFNLAVNYVHLGRYSEAAVLVPEVRDFATELEDEISLIRVTWLEGRIAAGQGRTREARRLLGQARREFERLKMSYDVALALLEEAVLLLDEGRTAEVKALADELIEVFAENGVHREALAAMRLFHEAAEREEATAELARRVLRFLFQARHDPELRFEP